MTDPIQDHVDRIAEDIRVSIAAIEFAIAGIQKIAGEISRHATPTPENPDPTIYVGEGDPNDPASRTHGAWTLSQLNEAASKDSSVAKMLTQQWIVATYSKWENQWRPELAALAAVAVDRVTSDVFGDLRRLRNDVVHHKGLATQDNSGRARVVTFQPGEVIHLTAARFVALQQAYSMEIAG